MNDCRLGLAAQLAYLHAMLLFKSEISNLPSALDRTLPCTVVSWIFPTDPRT
jgi:hypothetical protein